MMMLYIKYTSFVSCCCRDIFIYFHYKSMVDNDMPGAWPVWTPGAPLAAFIKIYDAPGAGPVWTPGARLAGFIKRTTIH